MRWTKLDDTGKNIGLLVDRCCRQTGKEALRTEIRRLLLCAWVVVCKQLGRFEVPDQERTTNNSVLNVSVFVWRRSEGSCE